MLPLGAPFGLPSVTVAWFCAPAVPIAVATTAPVTREASNSTSCLARILTGAHDSRGGRRVPTRQVPAAAAYSYGTKSFFLAPQTGQTQSPGISSKGVPGGTPPSGSPSAGS